MRPVIPVVTLEPKVCARLDQQLSRSSVRLVALSTNRLRLGSIDVCEQPAWPALCEARRVRAGAHSLRQHLDRHSRIGLMDDEINRLLSSALALVVRLQLDPLMRGAGGNPPGCRSGNQFH